MPTTGPNLLRRGEKPPVMPVEATQHTQAGAVAFAKFFIQTIDWGYATTSATYMKHYFDDSCEGCRTFSSGIEQARSEGERFNGGRFTVRGAAPITAGGGGAERTIQVSADISTFAKFDAYGKYLSGQPAQLGLKLNVGSSWRGSYWRAVLLDVTP